jgi:hypothetical protein
MRTIRSIRRGDDMPLYGTVLRVKKGLYQVVIKFVASKRVLHVEQVQASNPKLVKLFFAREYPTLTWGKPKYPRQPKPKSATHVKAKRKDRVRG